MCIRDRFIEKEICRVLAATIEAVAVAAHVVARAVLHDDVVARPIEPDADARVELDHVVPDAQAVGADEHQSFHALLDAHVPDLAAVDVLEIRARPEAQPLALLVVMVRQPVDETLVLDPAEQPRLPVTTKVVARESEVVRPAREEADLVAAHGGVDDADVAAPFY